MSKRRIAIHRSLHRPDLIIGVERDLFFPISIAGGIIIMSAGGHYWMIPLGVLILVVGYSLARKVNKAEPILTKVLQRHLNHKKYYPAKDSMLNPHKSIAYNSMSKKEKGFQSLLQYALLIDNGIILCKDGSFLVGYEITTRDTASVTAEQLNNFSASISDSLKHLGDGWCLHFNTIRKEENYYPLPEECFFNDNVSLSIDNERREIFKKEGAHYKTNHYLFISFKPSKADEKLSSFIYKEGGEKKKNTVANEFKTLEKFKNNLNEIEDAISVAMTIRRLVDKDGKSQLLSGIREMITGETYPVNIPKIPMFLDVLLASEDLIGGITPQIGENYIGVVAVDGFPQDSTPMMLSGLDSLSIPYRFNTRYVCLDQYTAKEEINNYVKSWSQQVFTFFDKMFNNSKASANQDAVMMVDDAECASLVNQSGYVRFGYFSGNIILLDKDKDVLNEKIREIRRVILTQGFSARVERVNALEAWLGSHPANNYSNLRRTLLHSLNLADILPLSTIYAGSQVAPCPFYPPNSPPLLYGATDGSTPFCLNLHVSDIGHTLIFGPTGAGKSTLLGFITAQFRRYKDATIFAFDKGMSMFPLTSACGGVHYEIAGDNSDLSFCPLQDIDSDSEQAWAEDWIITLCQLQKVEVKPEHRIAIHEALNQIRNSPKKHRSLSNLYHYIQHRDLKEAITHYTNMGAMGKLLDAPNDSLGFSDFNTFEIEDLMNLGEENMIPVLLYIFHRIEKSLKGQPSMLILDEAWIMLGNPVFRQQIREWLKVLRKANCAVVLATQSLSDAKNSGILDVLNESCATKIFLPNETANQDGQFELYKGLDLNKAQIDIIAQAKAKREYYVTSSKGSRLINLALTPLSLSFVGASSKEDIGRIKELKNEYGQAWVGYWLEDRGVDKKLLEN